MMSIQQDTSYVEHFRNSSSYNIVATAWSVLLLALGVAFLGSQEHTLVMFLAVSAGITYAPSTAITLMSFGIFLWRLFGSRLIATRTLFLVCTLVPLIPYAVANMMLVGRGQREADLVVLMLGMIGAVFLSWYFAERDAAQQALIQQLSERLHHLEQRLAAATHD